MAPNYKPRRGVVIISFTAEQVATYNVRLFGDKEFVISDHYHPDEHSIEEGVIFAVNDHQKELKPGDNILVDYTVFSSGRHDDGRLRADNSRLLWTDHETYLYFCFDDTHPHNSSEILGFIDEQGHVKAFGDAVIVKAFEEHEALIEVVTSVAEVHYFPGTQWAIVEASAVAEINEGDMILIEKGLSPTIKVRGITMNYINLPYIFGVAEINSPGKVKLF